MIFISDSIELYNNTEKGLTFSRSNNTILHANLIKP